MHSVAYDHQIFSLQQYGGISRYFCELAERVHHHAGFEARIVAGMHFNEHLSHVAVPQSSLYVPKSKLRFGLPYRLAHATVTPLLLRAARPSLVHRTYYGESARTGRVPVVLTVFDMIHELFAHAFDADDSTIRSKRASVAAADHVLCISKSTADDLIRLFDVDPARISITYLGYSDVFGRIGDRTEAAPHVRPYLLYVGQRGGYKNFETALRAYASSPALRNAFDFLAFGGSPFDESEAALIGGCGLRTGSVVQQFGSDQALARLYRHARAFVYPSRYEGFGIPPLEAMACDCPVACSNTSSLPEVVGPAAAMFDPDEVDAARAAIESVCLDDTRRASLIEAGRRRVTAFSWDRCAADTVAAYSKVLAGVEPARGVLA